MSKDTPEQLEAAMAALQAQRSVLGDAVVDTALLALRQQLAAQRAAAPTLPAQQLKQVSVLFVDVVGSTAIGQRLTPEDISAVMDGALARFTAIVQAHHGRVLQYTGDGMLAAFGTEVAHEDDVEAAVHAGLGIIDEARHAAPQVCSTHGVADFNVRVGIHTGRVLLGAGVDAEGSIRGAAVNLAARMEQTAPPGRLRISQDTYRHVNGLFDLVEQPPVLVKGVAEPVRGYLVERARPRALRVSTRGVEGVPTPMIGRDAELAQLLAAVDAVCAARRLCTVTVVGEAGLGKSRLVAEFQRALADQPLRCWLLPGRAHPRSALHPCGLLRDLFAGQLQIADDDSAETARSKFAAGLGPLFDAADAADGADSEATMHLLGHLIGLDYSASPHLKDCLHDDALLRQRGFAAAALCLRRLGRHRGVPVVLLLDDLHWADAGSLDFVQHLLQHEHDQPLLCLLLTRPALLEADARFAPPSGAADKPRGSHRWIELKPLGPANSRALADMLLQQVADVPAAMHTLLTSHAEGNPFYMEELVKMLLDDGVIVAEPQGWRVLPDKLVIAHVPQTLTGVLQARLDALAPAERTALQQAAIVGHLFSEATLAAIDPAAVNQLPVLLRKQLVRRAAQVFGETREYAFGHHLLHQVTEDSVLRDVKLRGHARVGAFWCARAEVAGPQDVDPAACRALAEAHDHCRQADPKAFVNWFDGQFFNYLNAYAGRVLRPLSQSVLALAEQHYGSDAVETARALTNLARVVLLQSESEGAEPMLRRALAIQEQALGADHPDTARTIAVLGGYFQGRGDLRSAEPLFRRALEIRERVLGPEHALTLGTLDHLAHAVTELGRLTEAEALCRRVLRSRENTLGADDPGTAGAMTSLGEVLAKKGEHGAAERLIRQALAVQQRCLPAEHPDIGLTMWHLAETLRAQGRAQEAEPLARQTLENWESAFGAEHEWTAWGLISLAELRLLLADAHEAAALAERALKIYQRLFGAQHPQVGATLGVLDRARGLIGEVTAG